MRAVGREYVRGVCHFARQSEAPCQLVMSSLDPRVIGLTDSTRRQVLPFSRFHLRLSFRRRFSGIAGHRLSCRLFIISLKLSSRVNSPSRLSGAEEEGVDTHGLVKDVA